MISTVYFPLSAPPFLVLFAPTPFPFGWSCGRFFGKDPGARLAHLSWGCGQGKNLMRPIFRGPGGVDLHSCAPWLVGAPDDAGFLLRVAHRPHPQADQTGLRHDLFTPRGRLCRVMAMYWHPERKLIIKVDGRNNRAVTVLTAEIDGRRSEVDGGS